MSNARKGDQRNYPNPYATGGGTTKGMDAETAGQRYRVRDDHEGGRVWGKNLTYQAAHKLKETVCGQRKSKNAILENMNIPYPPVPQQQYQQPVHVIPQAHPAPVIVQPSAQPQVPPYVNGEADELSQDALELADELVADGSLDAS